MDRYMKKFSLGFGCGLIGVLLAAILDIMNTRGIIIDEYITGSITIPEVMAITILIWVIIGVILAASS